MAVLADTQRRINQSKCKTSYANGQTYLGHKHKASDHNHEATQPMVNLPIRDACEDQRSLSKILVLSVANLH